MGCYKTNRIVRRIKKRLREGKGCGKDEVHVLYLHVYTAVFSPKHV